jgi:hypothetical protein
VSMRAARAAGTGAPPELQQARDRAKRTSQVRWSPFGGV